VLLLGGGFGLRWVRIRTIAPLPLISCAHRLGHRTIIVAGFIACQTVVFTSNSCSVFSAQCTTA
jgi:hypothetical protein